MVTIEAQLHKILAEIAPGMHELDEQANIIAEATDILRLSEASSGKRLGSAQFKQPILMDAILLSMNRMADWNDDDSEDEYDTINGTGLEPYQIVAKAAYKSSTRAASKWGDMSVLNDEDISQFLTKSKAPKDANGYEIEDQTLEDDTMHPDSQYHTSGTPRHRTDSLSR